MSTKKSLDVENIIIRAKQAIGIKTNSELAELLGIKQNTVSSWKTRGNIDLVSIIKLCNNVSTDWLIHGIGEPDPEGSKYDRETQMILKMLEGMETEQKRGVLQNLEEKKFIWEMMEQKKTGTYD